MTEYEIQTICLTNLEKTERLPAGVLAMLRASVERARVVAVLDGWAEAGYVARNPQRFETFRQDDGGWACTLKRYQVITHTGRKSWQGFAEYYGPTPDAARAAAAKAIEDHKITGTKP